MNSIQQTCYGLKALIYMLTGVDPDIDKSATVNENLAIFANERPTSNEPIRLDTLVIGNGGFTCTPGNNGRSRIIPRNHVATNASLFENMPFVLRPVDDDLSTTEREDFCLRKEVSHGGKNYYGYFGYNMNITKDNLIVNMIKVTKEDGTVIETPFVPDDKDLHPKPIDLPTESAIVASDVSVRISALVRVTLNERIVREIVDAAKILNNGDETSAIISEMALCTSAKRRVSVPSTDGQIEFSESIGTQVYTFSAELAALYYNKQELTIDFDIGSQIPLLARESIPTIVTIP